MSLIRALESLDESPKIHPRCAFCKETFGDWGDGPSCSSTSSQSQVVGSSQSQVVGGFGSDYDNRVFRWTIPSPDTGNICDWCIKKYLKAKTLVEIPTHQCAGCKCPLFERDVAYTCYNNKLQCHYNDESCYWPYSYRDSAIRSFCIPCGDQHFNALETTSFEVYENIINIAVCDDSKLREQMKKKRDLAEIIKLWRIP